MSTMCLRVALAVVVVAVGGVTMTPLKQISPQEVCPSQNSCRQRNVTNTIKDPCYCDELCNTYADCCYDSEFRNASQQKIDANPFRCRALGDEKVYVRIKCKAGWTDTKVEDLCVGGGVPTDPVSSLPVTSNATGYTYPNYYCAICNEDILGLRIWNGKLKCNLPTNSNINMNDLVLRNSSWGVLWGGPESEDFRTCSISPEMPQDIKNLTRNCPLSIMTCGEDWQDEEVASWCESYTSVIYYNSVRFRNPHCALCNKKKDNYDCFELHLRFPEIFGEAAPASFALILDFTDPSRSNFVGSSSRCNATQVWDPFFKRCRSIVCPKPDHDYRYGKCVALSDVNPMERSELTDAPTTTATTVTVGTAATTNNNNNSSSSNLTSSNSGGDIISNNSNITTNNSNLINNSSSHNNNNNTTTVTTSNTTASVTNNSSTTITTTNNTTTPDTLPSIVPSPTNTPESDPSTTASLETFPQDKHPIIFPEDPTEPSTTPIEEEIPTTPPPSTPSPDASTPTTPPPSTPSPDASTPTTPPPSTPSPDASTPTTLPPSTPSLDAATPTSPRPNTPSPDASTPTSPTPTFFPDPDSTDAAFSTNTSSKFAECLRVLLLEDEFIALPNGTVHVEKYERSYSPGEYQRVSEGVHVCLPYNISSPRKFSTALGWVSLAGLGLSCTSLLLHLAAFILLPELRNLSGRNLASLCLALLAAYITFLVNMLMRPDQVGCVTLAAAMYYFFVTSFTWMNVIAFDVWYTFRLTQRHLRVSNGDQWHRFIAYSLYSWLLPAAATLVLLLVDQLEPPGVPIEFLPQLGRNWCWFSHRRALLVFFAAPMVIIIVMNCVFFVSTAAIITQTGSTAAAASARGNHPRGQYKLYLRLAVLMGFTWVSGIVAGYLDLEALWYVFVVLNTMQGVFIFLAFTFRTRVWQGVGATCRKLLQRGLSKVTCRPPPSDIRAFELSHTPEGTSASYASRNSSLDAF